MIVNVGYLNNFIGSLLAGCLLSLTMGTLSSWTSPIIPKLQDTTTDNPFNQPITSTQASWMSSLLTLGALPGCWFCGFLADSIGRRIVLLMLTVPLLLGYGMMAVIHKVEIFLVARALQGFALGGAFALFMIYLVEISSKNVRGVALTILGMTPSLGVLLCYSVGPYISVTLLNSLLVFFALASFSMGLIFWEETPYFFLLKGKEDLARKAFTIFRGNNVNIEEDMQEMKLQIKEQREGNIIDIIQTKGYLKAFIIGNVLIMAQQFTGINGILMYSQTIFELTGSSLSPAICSIILGAIQLVSGTMSPFISSRFGKISILLTSGIGMAASEIVLGIFCILDSNGTNTDSIKFLPILCLTCFMLCYNFGFGPLCWAINGEVYPTRVKFMSMSFTVSLYFVIGFFIAQYFNDVVDAIGIGPLFLTFAGCTLTTCVFIKLYIIETKDLSLEEIQDILNGRKAQK